MGFAYVRLRRGGRLGGGGLQSKGATEAAPWGGCRWEAAFGRRPWKHASRRRSWRRPRTGPRGGPSPRCEDPAVGNGRGRRWALPLNCLPPAGCYDRRHRRRYVPPSQELLPGPGVPMSLARSLAGERSTASVCLVAAFLHSAHSRCRKPSTGTDHFCIVLFFSNYLPVTWRPPALSFSPPFQLRPLSAAGSH